MSPIPHDWDGLLTDPSRKNTYSRRVTEANTRLGSFLEFDVDRTSSASASKGVLVGLPFGVKDNIAVRGFKLTCGSRILENLDAPYTATAVKRLQEQGAVVVGKTNLDEFGMGSSNENSALGETVNPWDETRVAGGSSGGSAAAVAAGLVPLALGSDTGGSVRQPASFCGVYGLKPTYGSVSRYGLTAYASSLEVIGAITRDLDLLEKAFSLMSGADSRDQSSHADDAVDNSGRKVAVLRVPEGDLDPAVSRSYAAARESLVSQGYTMEETEISSLEYVVPAYYTIATAEASANLARFNGIRYGEAPEFAENPAELMKKARHEGFGEEVKLRILLGTFVLRAGFQDQYYGRAQRIRTLIRNDLDALFSRYDALLMPVFPTQAFPRGDTGMEPYRQRLADVYTCLANLAGLPALSIPVGVEDGLPAGIQVMAPAFAEGRLFAAARSLAEHFSLETPPGYLRAGVES